MARKVKCAICKAEIDKDEAFCIEKVNEKTNKVTRKYYCSEDEYNEDKTNKSLWRELLVSIDYILGYTCISKQKVNMLKEIENSGYSRKQLYSCIVNNKDEIKRYLDEKDILDEYGKLSYIFACIKNKIKDTSENLNNTKYVGNSKCEIVDCLEETDEDILRRLDRDKKINHQESLMDIIRRINNGR